MKKSLIWTTAGIAAVGFGVPAFAAQGDAPRPVAPAQVVTMPTPATAAAAVMVPAAVASTPTSVEDTLDATETSESTEVEADDATENSADDATENSTEDVSGNCDEAEHASDPSCTTAGASNTDNGNNDANSGRGGNDGSDDGSGHHGGGDDN